MSSTDMVQRTPQQELIAQVRRDDFKQQVAMALPPTVTPERFVRIATTAIMANPDIAKLDHVSVLRAMVQCAAMGLMPDGKQAAITPRKNQAVLVPMIQGFRDIAADHGWTLRTAVVYANDEFRHSVVDGEESISHQPVRPGADRGDLIAAYAIAKHRDGRKLMTVLHPDDIAKRRESSAYDAVWNQHPAAMWEKSAGRDLFGQLGFGELDERATRILAASATDPAEAARLIYGNTETPALPAGTGTNPSDVATSPPAQAGHTTDAGATQTSAAATSLPAAAEDPGHDDEPSLEDDPAVDQGVADAARLASQFHPPTGQYKDLSLAEILAVGEKGEGWLRWALGKGDSLTPDAYRQAVWSFARVFAPALFQAALAKQEATA